MTKLIQIHSPPFKTGRPPVGGTVLARGDGVRLVLVREVFSEGSDAGLTGSPSVTVWLALTEPDNHLVHPYSPVFVRRGGPREAADWSGIVMGHYQIRRDEFLDCLRLSGYTVADLSPHALPTWPTSIWDRRVILPDDRGRFPPTKRATVGKAITGWLTQRIATDGSGAKVTPDDRVWELDGRILGLAPKQERK